MNKIKLIAVLFSLFFLSECVVKPAVQTGGSDIQVRKMTGFGSGTVREDYTKSSLVFRYAQAAIKSSELGKERKALSEKLIVGSGIVGAQLIDGSGFNAGMGMLMISAASSDKVLKDLVAFEPSIFSPKNGKSIEAFFGLYEDTGGDAMLDAFKVINSEVSDLCFERPSVGGFNFYYTERVVATALGYCKDDQVLIGMVRVIHDKHFGKTHEGKIFVSIRGNKEAIEPFRKAYANDKTKGTLSHQVINGEPKIVAVIGGDTILYDALKNN